MERIPAPVVVTHGVEQVIVVVYRADHSELSSEVVEQGELEKERERARKKSPWLRWQQRVAAVRPAGAPRMLADPRLAGVRAGARSGTGSCAPCSS